MQNLDEKKKLGEWPLGKKRRREDNIKTNPLVRCYKDGRYSKSSFKVADTFLQTATLCEITLDGSIFTARNFRNK
jgi:hypothetical protein